MSSVLSFGLIFLSETKSYPSTKTSPAMSASNIATILTVRRFIMVFKCTINPKWTHYQVEI